MAMTARCRMPPMKRQEQQSTAAAGLGRPTGQQIDGAPTRGRLRQVGMSAHLLRDLPADRVDRRQGGHRILEDHGDLVALHMPQLALRQPDQFAALIDDRAFDLRAGIDNQADYAQKGYRLARAGLADDAETRIR